MMVFTVYGSEIWGDVTTWDVNHSYPMTHPWHERYNLPTWMVDFYGSFMYLEPNWPLFLKVIPPKQGNQNKGHLGSR